MLLNLNSFLPFFYMHLWLRLSTHKKIIIFDMIEKYFDYCLTTKNTNLNLVILAMFHFRNTKKEIVIFVFGHFFIKRHSPLSVGAVLFYTASTSALFI